MYTVYMHTTPDNKRYVGVTSKPVATRWGNGHGYSVNVMFSDAIKKHGWNNIKHEVLLMCENCDEAGALERQYVALYKTNDKQHGYNLTSGGEVQQDNAVFGLLFGEKIKTLRKKAGLTRLALAKMSMVESRTISSWEKGKFLPTVDKAAQLAAALKVSVDELCNVQQEETYERNQDFRK